MRVESCSEGYRPKLRYQNAGRTDRCAAKSRASHLGPRHRVFCATVSLACACLALVISGCAAGPEAPGPEAPNVVLITLDGLRRDHVSCFGYPRATTPNIDWLASRGLALSNMVPTSCSTKISLTSLFTSRDYPSHSVAEWRQKLDDEYVTLAEIFRDAGYTTAGFVGSPWIARRLNCG